MHNGTIDTVTSVPQQAEESGKTDEYQPELTPGPEQPFKLD